jgi:hypothetical protein
MMRVAFRRPGGRTMQRSGVPEQLSRAGVKVERTYNSMFNLITQGSILCTELNRLPKTRHTGLRAGIHRLIIHCLSK